jgi:NAD-dependent SIR2 family protein deacetylase
MAGPGGLRGRADGRGHFRVFLVIGASVVVYPAASLVPYARQSGAKVIEINLETTPFSSMGDCSLQAPAGELLPKLP